MQQSDGSVVNSGAKSVGPLRFCMITTFYPPYNFGGDGIFVQRLAEALAVRGHHVTVIHCIDAYRLAAESDPPQRIEHHPNIEVHSLESRLGPLSPLITHQLATPGLKHQAIQRILDENHFDIIHYHNISLVGGPRILSYGSAIKLFTTHEYWLVCPLSTLWKYDREPCASKNCITCTVRAGKPPQWWRASSVLPRSLEHVDALISPSRFMIDKQREMGLNAEFIHIPNFLSLSTDSDRPTGAPPERPCFLVVGRLEKNKGVQKAIDAFRQIDHADLLIVGSGNFEAELRAMAATEQHIHFEGHVPYEELVDLYRKATALIVPSIWYEPFGLIVLEAFAQQTPVIVNNAGALPELVNDSGGGIVYKNNEELVRAVEKLAQAPALRKELGLSGYRHYRENWTEEQHLARYFKLIERLSKQVLPALTPGAVDR